MTYQVLARKWRPQAFDAVVGQDAVTRTLRNALASGRVAHAYLFTGPRGVGKTTTARLLAKALACTARGESPEACGKCPSCLDFASGAPVDVLEIDAASNNGVDEIRTLRENVKYSPARGRFKVYVVDEVHMLSGPAFNAFLKTLEEPPPHVVFILATTDPKRIPPTVLSRCQRFDFRPIPHEMLAAQLTEILTSERVPFEPAALPLLIRASEGSLRDALSLLDAAIAYGEGKLVESSVAELLGSASPVRVREMLSALLAGDATAALEGVDRAARQGEDLDGFCRDVIEAARRLLVLTVAPGAPQSDLTPVEAEELAKAGEGIAPDEIVYMLRALLDAQLEMRRSPYPRVELEIAMVRATRRPRPHSIEKLIEKVEEAERQMRALPGPVAGGRPASTQESLLDDAPREAPPARRDPGPAAPPPPRMPVSGGSSRAAAPSYAPPGTAAPVAPAPAAAAPEAASAPSGAPAAGIDEAWERVVAAVMRKKALLGSVLQGAKPVAVRDGALLVGMAGNHFHRQLLEDRANRELINQAVEEHVAGARRLDVAAEEVASIGAANHPAVRATLAAFPGEVVSVRPRISDPITEEGESQ
jgi:DNA polymerase-3 subunit gamma/tau